MRKIALIACCKKKKGFDNPIALFRAEELYLGNSFLKSKNIGVAKYNCEDFYIISAKYYLLEKDEMISYYDKTLNKGMSVKERKEWANKVLEQLIEKGFNLSEDIFYIFGGGKYYEFLKDHLNCVVFEYENSNSILLDNIKAKYINGGK